MVELPIKIQDIFLDYVYLEFMTKILEQDLKLIEKVPFKIKRPYQTLIQSTILQIRNELKVVKAKMYKENLRINKPIYHDEYYHYEYSYKNGDSNIQMFWYYGMLLEASHRLDRYFGVESDYSM